VFVRSTFHAHQATLGRLPRCADVNTSGFGGMRTLRVRAADSIIGRRRVSWVVRDAADNRHAGATPLIARSERVGYLVPIRECAAQGVGIAGDKRGGARQRSELFEL